MHHYLHCFIDSLVSSHVYEVIKTIYSTSASESTDAARVSMLQNTLIQLRLVNIATLDAIMTHFTRLIELTSADEDYIASLAHSLAWCILRPRAENSMTMEEKHSYRLIRDLFAHKDTIFGELKRASSLTHSASIDSRRPRAISSDESNRKANMEARTRAILAAAPRSRATSPAPGPRGHHRDRSVGGPETRFPIQTSPTSATDSRPPRNPIGGVVRNSLEVPGSNDSSPVVESSLGTVPLQPVTNGSSEHSPGTPVANTDGLADDIGIEKRNSLGRSGHAGAGRLPQARRIAPGKQSLGSIGKHETGDSRPVGVSLTDKPMDD
jgi:hypothetical protein